MLHTRTLLAGAAFALLAGCGDSDLPTASAPSPASLRALGAEPLAGETAVTLTSGLPSSLCVDVSGGNPANGTPIIAWSCHGGANQQFTLNANSEIRTASGLCLDAASGRGRDGDAIIAYGCHGGANQKWTITAEGRVVGMNGKCLDIAGARTSPGTQLIIWTCHGGANQRWQVGGGAPAPTPPPAVPAPPAQIAGSAELPRASVDVTMPTQTGRTINVPAGGDLQAALDAAQPGDVVALAPGATYRGYFELWPKQGNGWIVVRTAIPDASLPAPGTRMTPARAAAANLAKIVTNHNGLATISTHAGVANWRFVGVEIGVDPSVNILYDIVALGTSGAEQQNMSQVPRNFVLDRVWVHGNPTLGFSRCVALNSANSAIVDSYLSDCHIRGGDSQAIAGWNGPGPYLIQNNYLDGAGENVMFGGADPWIQNLIPSDITIRGNHFHKPLGWQGVWSVKNLLEIKAGQRILVEGNIFENNWADAQVGFAFVFWSANAEGNALWSISQDITFRYNRVLNVRHGFNLADRYIPSLPSMRRVTIAHNVITGPDTIGGRMFQLTGDVQGVTVSNNTGFGGAHNVMFSTPAQPLPSFVFQNNIAGGDYTFFANGVALGAEAIPAMGIPAANVSGNVLVNAQNRMIPASNAQAPTVAALGFVNAGGGDFRLGAGSPFLASGTGGSTPGADIATITTMTQRVVGQ